MTGLFWLSDDQWRAIEPLLPKNQAGPRRVDDRRIISGIVHVLQSGCRWQDCPTAYGPFTTVMNRLIRWSKRDFWPELIDRLAATEAFEHSNGKNSVYARALRLHSQQRKKRSFGKATEDARKEILSGIETTVVKSPISTSFFVSIGEAVSVQVSVPSRPVDSSTTEISPERRLHAAQALLTAAMAILDEDQRRSVLKVCPPRSSARS